MNLWGVSIKIIENNEWNQSNSALKIVDRRPPKTGLTQLPGHRHSENWTQLKFIFVIHFNLHPKMDTWRWMERRAMNIPLLFVVDHSATIDPKDGNEVAIAKP